MALIREEYLRNLSNQKMYENRVYDSYEMESLKKALLIESSVNFSAGKEYDIFLSHCYLDKDIILGLKIDFENYGLTVYVDWIDDSQLDRTKVTRANVIQIQERMNSSKCLVFATSSNSSTSKWMPWELGYMDGKKDRVVICPISNVEENYFSGIEYLSIYPYIDKVKVQDSEQVKYWVNDQTNRKKYSQLEQWIQNGILKERN